jgi:hypothetical protein
MELVLNEYGYITNYLVSGRKETPYSSKVSGKDQLACEKIMRKEAVDHDLKMPEGEIRLGALSSLGMPWEYYYTYGNWFVDQSAFYPLLKKIELHAAVILNVPEDMKAETWLWSYGAVDVWVNGIPSGGIETPVYKPITREVLSLDLKKGDNLIFVRLQNLGVRDTRTLFAIQIPGEERHGIKVKLPHMESANEPAAAGQWLSEICLQDGVLSFPSVASDNTSIVYDSRPVDFAQYHDRYTRKEAAGRKEVILEPDSAYLRVEVKAGGQVLSRSFERQELLNPVWSEEKGIEENKNRVYERIASVLQIPRGDDDSFSMYPVLARRYTGTIHPDDEKEIYKSLDQIESRRDCSDFLTCAMVRYMKLYPMDEALSARCKEVMLNYRYWMDETGNDGMCFWSENHSLMFFVSAYIAGGFYPEAVFTRSGKTGKEMEETARVRIYDWMKETLKEGFDEFHSGGYTPITFAAILNVVDFGDEELSALAAKVADRLLHDLALQTFQGVSVAPMGRVYREVLYPFAQDIQCLINLIDPQAPDRFSEWIIFLATSNYQIPEGLKTLMAEPASLCYDESNASICVEKTKHYMLTSVQSKREGNSRNWENIYGKDGADMGSFAYVKSLNECFHGTTQFEPGVFGYQQHMWYAALDPAAVVFVNHPGGSCEACSVRPGYWFGNGIMPAIKQVKHVLYSIYRIPFSHPIPFTHVYWPQSRFKEQKREEGWLAGKAGTGYVAIWCSDELKPYYDQLFDCEYRSDSRDTAYICVCGSQEEFGSLTEFLNNCKKMNPVYDKNLGKLKSKDQILTYEEYENLTQYI